MGHYDFRCRICQKYVSWKERDNPPTVIRFQPQFDAVYCGFGEPPAPEAVHIRCLQKEQED